MSRETISLAFDAVVNTPQRNFLVMVQHNGAHWLLSP
jgi:hypothetical protein